MPILIKYTAALLLLAATALTQFGYQRYRRQQISPPKRWCCLNGPKGAWPPFKPYLPYRARSREGGCGLKSIEVLWNFDWDPETDAFDMHKGPIGPRDTGVPGKMPGPEPKYMGAVMSTPKHYAYLALVNLQKWIDNPHSNVGLSIYRYLGVGGMAVYMCCGDGVDNCPIWNRQSGSRRWVKEGFYCPDGTDKIVLYCTKPESMRSAACGFHNVVLYAENANEPYECDQYGNAIDD